jgi:hypothetical protein
MSSGKYIKQAIIASLCEHPDADKYRQKAFSGENLEKTMEAMAQQLQTLTKADFLAPDDDGKFIIDCEGAWKNFDKIAKIMQGNGDKLTYEDFLRPLGKDQQKTLLDSAVTHGGLGAVFTFDIWQGRFEEMERLWYKVPVPNRKDIFRNNGTTAATLKRKLFAAEGKVTPEDRLIKAGLTPSDIRQAFSWRGEFEAVVSKLTLAGDYMRKEYVLMTDSAGDTVFDVSAAWDKYAGLVKSIKEHGERFEIADYLKQVSYAKNILGRAAEHGALAKVFTPEHWEGRLQDMLTLWSQVLDGWKTASMTTRDFDNAYAEAESMTYAKRFQALAVTGKADLLKPLNDVSATEKPVLPLGLKAVWDKFDSVQAALKQLGGAVTISDLRSPTGQMGNSCLMCAVKFGHFSKVVEISRQGHEPVTLADFLSKDRHGNTLLSILADKNQLALAFAPEIWAGRVSEMKTLWSQVSVSQRPQVDFAQAEISAKQATLKQKKGGIKIQPHRPKGQE